MLLFDGKLGMRMGGFQRHLFSIRKYSHQDSHSKALNFYAH
jgi:hypothetical protein